MRLLEVQELIDQVRSQLDEDNTDSIDDDSDILPALNRAQNFAANILARHYEEPLLRLSPLPIEASVSEYAIPEDAFEDRIEKVEISIGQDQYEVQRISYRDISSYESSLTVNIPKYYAILGRKIRLVPAPSGTYSARIWYLQSPEKLVKSQGRITVVDTASNYIRVNQAGSILTTETDNLNSFVNIVDGQTGIVKTTLQIKSISDNKITFKTTPSRTNVFNRTIGTTLADLEIEQDDHICLATGSCILFFRNPISNFLIQYSVAELTRKLGGEASSEEQVLSKFEQQVERSWVGREQSLRVTKKSKNWDRTRKRWPYS
jgi:hypothetical protein